RRALRAERMSQSNADHAWSLDETSDEFVLEQDDTFATGKLEEAPLPPFDADELAPAGAAMPADDPFGLTTPAAHAPLIQREDLRATEQRVPRITIHASCDRPEIADLISGIVADRRMARAEITVEPGGIEAAISRFSATSSPNLLIIDTVTQ